ncbi:hypothetical protein B0H17DRAFT_1191398 [Mycena rosella]|uniref:RING-type domain-containing protein n=1 Tax=Mycena rosella TaxID=1033263 RepID=A0AAD7GZP5_MYCRO|nr:hypothetical protein B0H17DRAFT_1191398 [Mycena rosella]
MSRPERSGIVANRIKKITIAVASTRTPFTSNAEPLFAIPSQRSKSRSPSRNGSGSRTDPFTLLTAPVAPTIKRKRSSTSVGASSTPAATDDTDRGQRIKPKASVASGSGQNRALPVASGSSSSHRPKKERERSRAVSEYVQRLQSPNPLPSPVDGYVRRGVDKGKSKQVEMGTILPPTPSYSGALAAAEYERMRKELETLKKDNKDARKQLKKQNKTIEELRVQVATETLAREEQEKVLTTVTSKSRKNEELLQTIELSLQCQICIELLSKPYALAPCGHILCLECLQQWFRSAPANDSDDEMDAEANEEFILHRVKSCPCCRATIMRRPVPVFVVKSVVTALRAAATAPAEAQAEDADPWKGLFLPDYESPSDDDDGEGYESSEYEDMNFVNYSEEDDLDGAEVELAMGLGPFPQELARFYESASGSEEGSASESGEDEEDEEEAQDAGSDDDADVVYSLGRWEPPTHRVEFENVSNALWKMQRRGCTPRLIMLFNMRYTHDEGLVAHVSSLDAVGGEVTLGRNRLFLGWNISIDPSDGTVEGDPEKSYVAAQLRDIRRHSERWIVSERYGFPGRGIVDARRLVPVEEDADIYDTSDSEAYSNGEDFV